MMMVIDDEGMMMMIDDEGMMMMIDKNDDYDYNIDDDDHHNVTGNANT